MKHLRKTGYLIKIYPIYFIVVADDRRFLHFFFVSLSLLFSLSLSSVFIRHTEGKQHLGGSTGAVDGSHEGNLVG